MSAVVEPMPGEELATSPAAVEGVSNQPLGPVRAEGGTRRVDGARDSGHIRRVD